MSAPIQLPGFRIETLVFGKSQDVVALAGKLAEHHGLKGDPAWFTAPAHTALSKLGAALRLPAWVSSTQAIIPEDIYDKPARELHAAHQTAHSALHTQHPETLALTLMRRDLPLEMEDHYALMFSGVLPVSWGMAASKRDSMFGNSATRRWWLSRDLPYQAQDKPWSAVWDDDIEAVDSIEAVFHRMEWAEVAFPWARVQHQAAQLDGALPTPVAIAPRLGRF